MPRRAVIRVALFMLLGAIVNVAVAWACATWIPFPSRPLDAGMSAAEAPCWLVFRTRAFGIQWTAAQLTPVSITTFPVLNNLSGELAERPPAPSGGKQLSGIDAATAGWPAFAMATQWRHSYDSSTRKSTSDLIHGIKLPPVRNYSRALPLAPLWSGFALNTLFYAAILWLLFAGPFALRRTIRRRRGRCAACGYPIGSSPVCTECGAAVTNDRTVQR